MSWVASTEGYTGDDVRDVMLAAVEGRFGTALPGKPIQWLSDNGSAYTAALTHLGYLETDVRQFWLASKALRLSDSYLATARLPRLVQPVLDRLEAQTGAVLLVCGARWRRDADRSAQRSA